MDMVVAALVSFLQAVNSGSWILLVFVLIGLAWITAGLVYRRILNERRRTTSKATQENFEATAAELRKRALEMKQGDDELWKREQEVTGRDEPEALLEDTDAELRSKRPVRPYTWRSRSRFRSSLVGPQRRGGQNRSPMQLFAPDSPCNLGNAG
jgi:hypothetical protein